MVNSITLTSSMRSNLSSLKTIATQMDKTQNILSTGKKVNSAIDNASSYYQARSLTNRASDLNSLLDSMGQGIQTLQAANEGIEAATAYLEQAKAVAEEVLTIQKELINQEEITDQEDTAITIKNKEWLEQQDAVFTFTNRKGEVISSVVTNKEDLIDAVASGKAGDIIVFGEIDMGSNGIVLADNQNLVGVDKYSAGAKTQYSQLTFNTVGNAIEAGNGSTIGWLDINGKVTKTNDTEYASMIFANNMTDVKLNNLDINILGNQVNTPSDDARRDVNALEIINGAKVDAYGDINIKTTGYRNYAIFTKFNAELNFHDANVNITTTGGNSFSIVYESGSNINLYGKTNLFIKQNAPYPIIRGKEGPTDDTLFNILSPEASVFLDVHSAFYPPADGDTNISVVKGAKLYVRNTLYTATKDEFGIQMKGGNNPNLTVNGKNDVFSERSTTIEEWDIFNQSMSKVLADDFPKNENTNDLEENNQSVEENNQPVVTYSLRRSATKEDNTSVIEEIIEENLEPATTFAMPRSLPEPDETPQVPENTTTEEIDYSDYVDQYEHIINEFNTLIEDASYQGINLLTGGEMKVTFNETRTHSLAVKGQDIRSDKIGLTTINWENKSDVKAAINEITSAINKLRSVATDLGNKYSIIQTRQTFTEAMTDVLETGADDLVLADMNETSAEYLMLQTRQQLAVNSLSLASQSATSILSLF